MREHRRTDDPNSGSSGQNRRISRRPGRRTRRRPRACRRSRFRRCPGPRVAVGGHHLGTPKPPTRRRADAPARCGAGVDNPLIFGNLPAGHSGGRRRPFVCTNALSQANALLHNQLWCPGLKGRPMSNVPDGAQRSEDGYWWWDGNQWQPVEGGQGAGGEAYYETTGSTSTQDYPGDGGLPPGGVPAQQVCSLGPCPACSEDRQMSSPCVFLMGHDGEHECAHGDAWEQADEYATPERKRCDAPCQTSGCDKRCIRDRVHYPPEHMCNLGHTW